MCGGLMVFPEFLLFPLCSLLLMWLLSVSSHTGISFKEILPCLVLFWYLLLRLPIATVNSVVLKLRRALKSPGRFVTESRAPALECPIQSVWGSA